MKKLFGSSLLLSLFAGCGLESKWNGVGSKCDADSGYSVFFEVDDLNELRLQCTDWQEYQYWNGHQLLHTWVCEKYIEAGGPK